MDGTASKGWLERVMEYRMLPSATSMDGHTSAGTVFIVDSDAPIREDLFRLLNCAGLNAMCFASAEEFLAGWNDTPGCVMLDAQLPGMSGFKLQQLLLRRGTPVPIIFMAAHANVPMVRSVMKAGAVDFLTKPFEKEEMLSAIRQGFALDDMLRKERRELNAIQARLDSLTPREREVMHLVVSGLLNKQTAAELNLSEISVKLHRRHVLQKMQAETLADLVRMLEKVRATKAE